MKSSLKRSIKQDIKKIDQILQSDESGKALYNYLVSKYCSFDVDFQKGLPCLPIEVLGAKPPKYSNNLLAVKGKLEILLVTNAETRFYKKEGFVSGVITGVVSSLAASGILALIKILINLLEQS